MTFKMFLQVHVHVELNRKSEGCCTPGIYMLIFWKQWFWTLRMTVIGIEEGNLCFEFLSLWDVLPNSGSSIEQESSPGTSQLSLSFVLRSDWKEVCCFLTHLTRINIICQLNEVQRNISSKVCDISTV